MPAGRRRKDSAFRRRRRGNTGYLSGVSGEKNMTGLSDKFPEIYRYRVQEPGKVRLISGFAAALALCLALAYSVAHTTGSWRDYMHAVLFMQFCMLVFYGTLCTAR